MLALPVALAQEGPSEPHSLLYDRSRATALAAKVAQLSGIVPVRLLLPRMMLFSMVPFIAHSGLKVPGTCMKHKYMCWYKGMCWQSTEHVRQQPQAITTLLALPFAAGRWLWLLYCMQARTGKSKGMYNCPKPTYKLVVSQVQAS